MVGGGTRRLVKVWESKYQALSAYEYCMQWSLEPILIYVNKFLQNFRPCAKCGFYDEVASPRLSNSIDELVPQGGWMSVWKQYTRKTQNTAAKAPPSSCWT